MARVKPYNPVCPRCDYSLRGLTQPACPECGAVLNETGYYRHGWPGPWPLILRIVALVALIGVLYSLLHIALVALLPMRLDYGFVVELEQPASGAYHSCKITIRDHCRVWRGKLLDETPRPPELLTVILYRHDKSGQGFEANRLPPGTDLPAALTRWMADVVQCQPEMVAREADIVAEVITGLDQHRLQIYARPRDAGSSRAPEYRAPSRPPSSPVFSSGSANGRTPYMYYYPVQPDDVSGIPILVLGIIGGLLIRRWNRRRRALARWDGPLPIDDPAAKT